MSVEHSPDRYNPSSIRRTSRLIAEAEQENGNILFLILIAVALFAALSYAVTSSSRGGSKDASAEIRRLDAAQILQYAASIEQAVTRIKVINGCSDTDISFYMSNIYDLTTFQHTPEVADKCKVFHTDGGGVPYHEPKSDWFISDYSANVGHSQYWFTGRMFVVDIGTTAGNPANAELLFSIMYIDKELCVKLNEALDVENPLGEPPQEPNSLNFGKFNGIYAATGLEITEGQYAACITSNGDGAAPPAGTHHFYYVLIAR